MLPFLKKRDEGGMAGPVETEKRSPDNPDEQEYGMLDAIAEDLISAVHKKDKSLLKSCLEALIEHIQDEDQIQDKEMS